jgi:hypothetical protein
MIDNNNNAYKEQMVQRQLLVWNETDICIVGCLFVCICVIYRERVANTGKNGKYESTY